MGAPLQPWHALLAVASWLADLGAHSATPADLEASIPPAYPQRNPEAYAAHERWRAQGLPSLFYRLLALARAYHSAGAVFEAADLTVLALRAVFECVSNRINQDWHEAMAADPALRPGVADDTFVMSDVDDVDGANDADDTDELNDADNANDADSADDADDARDTNDTGESDGAASVMDSDDDETASIADQFDATDDRDDTNDANDAIEERIRRTGWPYPIPAVYSLTPAQVVAAMRRLAVDLEWNLPPEKITPDVVGRLLGLLRLESHRTAHQRSWSITPAHLLRLARAYSQPLPYGLERLLTSVAPNPPP